MTPSVNVIRSILMQDPVWSAYALADLRTDLLPLCRWTVAGDGLLLIFTGLEPPILLTVGPAADVETALAQAELPEKVYLSVRHEHLPPVQALYAGEEYRVMVRMALGADVAMLPTAHPVRRLPREDVSAIEALIGLGGPFAPDGFAPYQVDDGFFFGVKDRGGELAAVGGTHIINRAEGVAAIGNVYTRPDCRGKGYARAITTEIVSRLRAAGLPLIVLNVNRENEAARKLYDSLGFVEHCSFVEGIVRRRIA